MTDDKIKIMQLEQRLAKNEELTRAVAYQLDKLIKNHNQLFDAHVALLKAHDNCVAEIAHNLDDIQAQVHLVTDKVAPEQLRFEREVNRILHRKGDRH